jgi:tripartite-type tricarboxylate transporter receptor subunit TctC
MNHSSFIIHHSALILLCAALASVLSPAQAQQYPTRPVRLIVPLAAGGGMDTVARAVSIKLTDQLGQSVIVDNRGGGGGSIGAELAASAPPDGYTLIMMSATSVIHPLLYKARYDTSRDFAAISQVTSQPYVIVVNNALPIKSVNDLVAYAKANPSKLNFASSGNGSLIHLTGELFKLSTGINLTHIPYKGIGAAYPDLIAGNIQLTFASIISAMPHIRAQRLRALAVTGSKRAKAIAELPTAAELGIKNFNVSQWYGVFAPGKTPRAVVDKVHGEIVKALPQPEVGVRLAADGAEPVGSTPQEFAAHVREEREKWGKVIKQTGIKGE